MTTLFTWACIDCGKMHYDDTHFRTRCRDEIACDARQKLNYIKVDRLGYMMGGFRNAKKS